MKTSPPVKIYIKKNMYTPPHGGLLFPGFGDSNLTVGLKNTYFLIYCDTCY